LGFVRRGEGKKKEKSRADQCSAVRKPKSALLLNWGGGGGIVKKRKGTINEKEEDRFLTERGKKGLGAARESHSSGKRGKGKPNSLAGKVHNFGKGQVNL